MISVSSKKFETTHQIIHIQDLKIQRRKIPKIVSDQVTTQFNNFQGRLRSQISNG